MLDGYAGGGYGSGSRCGAMSREEGPTIVEEQKSASAGNWAEWKGGLKNFGSRKEVKNA